MILPKPDLTSLTGGYRKTPVLQIGAEIYCDTRLIARELERRYPSPTLFPGGHRGMSLALSHWSDTAFFEPGAALSMALAREVPEAVIEDRKSFFAFMDFSRLQQDIPHMSTQLRANAALLEQQLSDGRSYLLGPQPGWADISAYFPLWMARTFVPSSQQLLAANQHTGAWEERMRSIGHGRRTDIDANAALDIARNASPDRSHRIDCSDPLQFKGGEHVTVAPTDYGKVPVSGELVVLETEEVAVLRHDPRVGEVVVHFPRTGYRIERG